MIEVGDWVEFTGNGTLREGEVVWGDDKWMLIESDYGIPEGCIDPISYSGFIGKDDKMYVARTINEVKVISCAKYAKIKTEFLQGIEL